MKKFTIIAVDDDAAYLESLRQFFSKHKDRYDLSAANCISKFQDHYNIEYMIEKIGIVKPDVVLMDFSFSMAGQPHDFGIQLVKEIRYHYPNQHIIMLVGDNENDEVRWNKISRSFEAGAAAYIGKQDVLNCMEAIDEVVKGDVYLSESARLALRGLKSSNETKYKLTPRQREVLKLLSDDHTIAGAAAQLKTDEKESVTPHVVNFHLQNIKHHLHTKTLHGTIAKAIREKII